MMDGLKVIPAPGGYTLRMGTAELGHYASADAALDALTRTQRGPIGPADIIRARLENGRLGYRLVMRADGQVLIETLDLNAARAMRRRLAEGNQRNCISCGAQFTSKGVGNRMCPSCVSNASAVHDGWC